VQIQVNTDRNIGVGDRLVQEVEDHVTSSLKRFGSRVTRVEVHLSDVNAHKGGRDTRCVMEARVAGMDPVAVDELARDVHQAVRGAAGKLERALSTRLGKLGRR
jgi:ribosome-associated translation inhibitor RaiA